MRPQQPVSIERPMPNRQDDEWSSPSPTDVRRDDTERHQLVSTSSPVAPPPTEERLFTDWSSEGSPRERNVRHTQAALNVEPQRTEITTRESEREQAIRYRLNAVSITPSVQIQTDQLGPGLVDRGTNTTVVDI